MTCTKENQQFGGDFHATPGKIEAGMFELTKKWN